MIYTDDFLISELHRFYNENNRVPTRRDMLNINGYPSGRSYINNFKTWNKALDIADFKLNKLTEKRTGTEICCKCGCSKEETVHWHTRGLLKDEVMCHNCYAKSKSDYMNGNLDINSATGLGRAGEICVAKTLKIINEYDCNRISCGYHIDLYHVDKYKKIDVKTSLLTSNRNSWNFSFGASKVADTYICLGLSFDRKNVEHVWIVSNIGDIKDRYSFTVTNSRYGLSNKREYEVYNKPYNDIWETMKLDNCNIMIDKNKNNPIKIINS